VPCICFLSDLFPVPLPEPWWQVDLQENVAVEKISIYNYIYAKERLSYAAVSLLGQNEMILGVYHLPDMRDVDSKTILISDFGLNHDVRKVKVQIQQHTEEFLYLAEVEVYDESGNNKARGKHTEQSSTSSKMDSTKAVDGNHKNYCSTNKEVGK
jgi:hypothetical protein